MSSTEPPSRVPPKGQNLESKSARDELSSKGKVEKVREVDADETRKRKFQKFYKGDQTENESETRPSPFDLASEKSKGNFGGPLDPKFSLGDVDNAVVPNPQPAQPPNVEPNNQANEDDNLNQNALPHSDDFWEDVDFPPDKPSPPRALKETENSHEARSNKDHKDRKKKEALSAGFTPPEGFVDGKAKPSSSKKSGKGPREFDVKIKDESAPLDAKGMPQTRALEKEEERYLGKHPEKSEKKESAKQQSAQYGIPEAPPLRPEDREGGGGSKQGHDKKAIEIEGPSLPALPPQVQPMAAAAAAQASSYIQPATVSLFYQMVGTMYVMANSQGVNRTEIVLNNPSFAGSKFFGATISIEKYATAPDSFNITLTGSNEAVKSFQENIPSLMSAFQNGNFAFRVNRLDAQYTTDRPVFRRRDKDEQRGEAGGGDLGEGK